MLYPCCNYRRGFVNEREFEETLLRDRRHRCCCEGREERREERRELCRICGFFPCR